MSYDSWGNYPKVEQEIIQPDWLHQIPKLNEFSNILPQGLARSYGDVCLNNNGKILSTRKLNRIINFDPKSGIIECEAGISLKSIIEVVLPQGWFLPVTPGTQFVTLGGAIANDVHGKNHHLAGTFSNFILELKLLRSETGELVCSRDSNPDLFAATIAGLGLTGLILSAKLQLKAVPSAFLKVEHIAFKSLDEFFEISKASQDYEYTVAWLDCVSTGTKFTRGIFMRGEHSEYQSKTPKLELTVPFFFPKFALNSYSVKLFNEVYYYTQSRKQQEFYSHYKPFFYPLDAVYNWNRIYGKAGFLQFQGVIPAAVSKEVTKTILKKVVANGSASFLAVLKEFGAMESLGLLSFPRQGTTICLDFACNPKNISLYQELEKIIYDCNGAIYPAKDALMSKASFLKFYPNFEKFKGFKDSSCSSSFYQRVVL